MPFFATIPFIEGTARGSRCLGTSIGPLTLPALFVALFQGDMVRLVDTFRKMYPSDTTVGTFNGFTGNTSGEKIDAILISPEWSVRSARIDRTNSGGRYPSDHFPVTATLLLY